MFKYRLFLCSTALAFVTNNANAYIPKTGHEPITRLALQGYQYCFNDNTFDLPASQKRLLQGNSALDHGTESFSDQDEKIPGAVTLFHLVTRVTNWHFYNPQKTAFSKQKNVEKSHKRLWAMALDGLEKVDNKHDKLLFLGAILHLLEDVSVPAHVMPVYHGPTTLVDWLGDFEKLTQYMREASQPEAISGFFVSEKILDQIDNKPLDHPRLLDVINNKFKPFCDGLKTQPTANPNQIRAQLADTVLSLIRQPVPQCAGAKWSRFWSATVPSKTIESTPYFNRYNTEQGFPLFGQSGQITDDNGQVGCAIKAGDARYLDFVFRLHLEAIKADIKLLYWAKSRLNLDQ